MSNYFIDNTTTCPSEDQTGLDWEHAWESLVCSGITGLSLNNGDVVYVKATDVPYLTHEWGFLNNEDGPYISNSLTDKAYWYFDAIGVGTTRGIKRATVTGRKVFGGWVQDSEYKYKFIECSSFVNGIDPVGLSYYGESLPLGAEGVWVNGIALTRVATSIEVTSGHWCYDSVTGTLYFNAGETPTEVQVVFSIRGIELSIFHQIYGVSLQYCRQGCGNGDCGSWGVYDSEIAYHLTSGFMNLNDSATYIQRNKIHNNGLDGIYNESNAPNIQQNCIYNNGRDGVRRVFPSTSANKTWILQNNTIYGNVGYGVNDTTSLSAVQIVDEAATDYGFSRAFIPGGYGMFNASKVYVAGSFIPSVSFLVSQIRPKLIKVGSLTGTLTGYIYSDNAGDIGTLLGTSQNTVDVSTLLSGGGFPVFYFGNISVTQNTGYYFVLKITGTEYSESNHVLWALNEDDYGDTSIISQSATGSSWDALAQYVQVIMESYQGGSLFTDTLTAKNNIATNNTLGQFNIQDHVSLLLAASNNCPGTTNKYDGKWEANKGAGNVEADPLLNSSYGLKPGSPCINAGVFIPGLDIVIGGKSDMGCCERHLGFF